MAEEIGVLLNRIENSLLEGTNAVTEGLCFNSYRVKTMFAPIIEMSTYEEPTIWNYYATYIEKWKGNLGSAAYIQSNGDFSLVKATLEVLPYGQRYWIELLVVDSEIYATGTYSSFPIVMLENYGAELLYNGQSYFFHAIKTELVGNATLLSNIKHLRDTTSTTIRNVQENITAMFSDLYITEISGQKGVLNYLNNRIDTLVVSETDIIATIDTHLTGTFSDISESINTSIAAAESYTDTKITTEAAERKLRLNLHSQGVSTKFDAVYDKIKYEVKLINSLIATNWNNAAGNLKLVENNLTTYINSEIARISTELAAEIKNAVKPINKLISGLSDGVENLIQPGITGIYNYLKDVDIKVTNISGTKINDIWDKFGTIDEEIEDVSKGFTAFLNDPNVYLSILFEHFDSSSDFITQLWRKFIIKILSI